MQFETARGRLIFRIAVPTPFPVGDVNIYLLEENGWILVDTGPHSSKAFEVLGAGLRALNLRWQDVKHVVITHGHMDHHGLTAAILEQTKARVYVHALDVAKVAHFEKQFIAVKDRYAQFLRLCGVAPEVIDQALEIQMHLKKYCRPVHVDCGLADGDQLNGSDIAVIHTPGHQEGSICLQVDDVLLTGDHILKHISPNPFVRVIAPYCGLSHYLASLKKIALLAGIKIGLPGHGEPVTDVTGRVHEIIKHHEERSSIILSACAKHHTVFELAQSKEVFPEKVSGGEIFLALVEVLSHLEYLEEQGQVVRIEKEGVSYFEPSGKKSKFLQGA